MWWHRDGRWGDLQPGEQLIEEVAPELCLKERAGVLGHKASPSLLTFSLRTSI